MMHWDHRENLGPELTYITATKISDRKANDALILRPVYNGFGRDGYKTMEVIKGNVEIITRR